MFTVTCAICNKSVFLGRFKFIGGYVCKACYAIVSRHFTETIVQKEYADLLEIYNQYKKNQLCIDEFEITKKIENIVLFDEKHKLICLPNHRMFTSGNRLPEIFKYTQIKKCEIREKQAQDNWIEKLHVDIFLQDNEQPRVSIVLLAKAVRKSSFAYVKALELSKRIVSELEEVIAS
ncbi:DUF4428 domain-containing protein [Propionispora vibrioides]|uniref:DUF4428 domain-containing protein n=1 Tax=Propionispora vibrioides TaxID=112903 RepID=A0A1H8SHG3_9FIRM|nr:DUF4428 domain-containing protein [Propionispora vibrioides]SEO78112.1 hypothetical protein SAMN04490178_10564 [Propionispora vibrioides]